MVGAAAIPGDVLSVMARPERVEVRAATAPPTGPNVLPGRVVSLTFRGAHTTVVLDFRGLRVEAEVGKLSGSPPEWLREGSDVAAQLSPHALDVLSRA